MELRDLLPEAARVRQQGYRVRVGGALGFIGGRDLVTAEGVTREHAAAVIVSCQGMVRTRKEAERRIGPHRAAQMFRGEPPPPMTAELRHLEVILGVQPLAACSQCTEGAVAHVRPGVRECSECSGTGRVAAQDNSAVMLAGVAGLVASAVIEAVGAECPACRGQRLVQCAQCDGTGQAMRAVIGSVTDSPVAFEHIYVPSLAPALESKLEAALGAAGRPPECLRIEPRSELTEFAGFAFGERLDRARQAIARTVGDGDLLGGWLDCFAWPVLVLRSDDGRGEAVVFSDPAGKLRSVVET